MTSAAASSDLQPTDARLRELLAVADPMVVSDAVQAEALLREAHALALHVGDVRSQALALTLLGATFYFRSQYHQALAVLTEAQEAADLAQDSALQSRVANNMGICAVALGRYADGIHWYQRSLDVAQAHGDDAGRARTLSNVGLIHVELGDYELALEIFEQVMNLTHSGEERHSPSMSSNTINMVYSYYHVGKPQEALSLALEHLPVVQALGIRQHEVVLRAWMVPCLVATGQTAEAARQAEALLPLAEQVNDHEQLANVRMFYGQALAQMGQLDAAYEQLQLALGEARRHEIRTPERLALLHLSRVHADRGEWQQAYETLQSHEELSRSLQAQTVERKAKVLSAQMQLEILRREAEVERRRNTELTQANVALQAAQNTLQYRATHDALTGLANRAHFQAEVAQALDAEESTRFGILFLDLDRFKEVNDTLGHDVGDELLQAVARRLTQSVRAGDLVARMGGDEFTVILRNLRSDQDIDHVAQKILNQLVQPVQIKGHTLHVTASIGAAVAPRDGQDVTTLQRHADIAMYRAKQAGKNGVRLYHPAMGEAAAERVDLERDLRQALDGQQFTLHYQGQFDGATGALQGFEALVRWQHATQGVLLPSKFIGMAEETQLILPLGVWVLQEACRQAAAWHAVAPRLTISVNVSAVQFEHPGFSAAVREALDRSGLPAGCLILELTESAVLRDPTAAAAQLTHLKRLGVRVALDDFGTGQSSLSLLHSLPIDELKIDRSFVQSANRVLLEVMLHLAQGLNLRVVAEGVETADQQALLRMLGCDSLQGYLLARPASAEDVRSLLIP
ncbi:EAL domain-containing protein [Deinococcus soli (ex Cha et al. 2016)]|uniref:Diguanylate cyclase (GGDEF)-like protein n=2 Tax=Deinococcus soli (ex Cha et al. 2016) TaxID=1309411 RepID=A0ACC6KQF8_9DEIO|nr:EAL domain-containing protein [Deinococcus soli (ex Cha et al. 2016)]MDR6221494.1 diguanylate cyclase (GGDEF)-like protein [Deinococcus soli (ex Cha et al. 2016)]MDR6331484.1 diguanylate cyclase (GGDEF)-like protein [Deinococcus soli (ex Cha et al. 2016)]MDR6754651.1 diguanylate cyclase (GGDEF)-like protein [Deinococcus soli (ex Cha et al. 2016)]